MKVRLAALSSENLTHITAWVEKLRLAVDHADVNGMDLATEALERISNNGRHVDLTEDAWREWLAEVRIGNPEFKSDYLFTGEFCTRYFPDATPAMTVLQLPMMPREGDDV